MREVYLHPGQLVASADAMVVTTILGSCVAVCLRDADSGVAGINHFLLPEPDGVERRSTRFARGACAALLERLVDLGARIPRLEAKVFGGASAVAPTRREDALGWRNVLVARAFLAGAGIPVASEDVGGGVGRKLVYETANGNVWVRTLGDPA